MLFAAAAVVAHPASSLLITMTLDPHHPNSVNDLLSNVTLVSGDSNTPELVCRWTRMSAEVASTGLMDLEFNHTDLTDFLGSSNVVSGRFAPSGTAIQITQSGEMFGGFCTDPICDVDDTVTLQSLSDSSMWTGGLSAPNRQPSTCVTCNVVPEPSTALLIYIGLMVLAPSSETRRLSVLTRSDLSE